MFLFENLEGEWTECYHSTYIYLMGAKVRKVTAKKMKSGLVSAVHTGEDLALEH